ncbi:MAG: superoxide dismutase [Fe], partial [Myxococcales bacterium]|nr:superoxide dismutase [Fe] [Myxococcales bacterium]
MPFELPALPYAKDALAPHMSAETLEYHYGKHHAGYLAKLNAGIEGTQWADKSLEDIIRGADGGLFNNAAQVWNHSFFWNCLKPGGGGEPSGDLADAINRSFGSYADFKSKFAAACAGQFGSGWGW